MQRRSYVTQEICLLAEFLRLLVLSVENRFPLLSISFLFWLQIWSLEVSKWESSHGLFSHFNYSCLCAFQQALNPHFCWLMNGSQRWETVCAASSDLKFKNVKCHLHSNDWIGEDTTEMWTKPEVSWNLSVKESFVLSVCLLARSFHLIPIYPSALIHRAHINPEPWTDSRVRVEFSMSLPDLLCWGGYRWRLT